MQEISKNSVVTLTYDLRVNDEKGELIEQASTENPLQFLYGAGIMLPKFETHLEGLKQGEPFKICLSKNEAYGEVNNDAIVELSRHIFLVDGKFDEELVSPGNTVPMMTTNGQRLNGVVLEVSDDKVKMDFNHPLAGEDLYFSGEVLEVREAFEEELAEALNKGDCGNDKDCSDCGGNC
jgi:FKBP-type peptidyl-prolyl cis-trans isomerase SlyD